METIEVCAICGSASVCHEVVDETFSYKGHEIIIDDYEIIRCDSCEEEIVSKEALEKSKIGLKAFIERVDNNPSVQ